MSRESEQPSLGFKVANIESLNPKPRPVGDRCNPLCPYFKCWKDALMSQRSSRMGITQSKPFCLVLGETCRGLQCRYSRCALLAGSVDGRCLLVVRGRGSA